MFSCCNEKKWNNKIILVLISQRASLFVVKYDFMAFVFERKLHFLLKDCSLQQEKALEFNETRSNKNDDVLSHISR